METKFASAIVTDVEPLIVPELAVIVAVPTAAPVTTPELLTEAMVEVELLQNTPDVSVFVLPSL